MIKNYNYKEYPEKLDYNNGTQRPSRRVATQNNVTKFFFYINVGLRKGDALSVI